MTQHRDHLLWQFYTRSLSIISICWLLLLAWPWQLASADTDAYSAATKTQKGNVTDHGVILLYHHISNDTPPSTSLSPDVFKKQLHYLEQNGFTVWPLSHLLDQLFAGKPIPPNTVALTFDDAYQSVYTKALPELKKRRWPFTIFVNTEAIDRGYAPYMSWRQLRDIKTEMQNIGVEIANHSHTHPHMIRRFSDESDNQWRQRMRNEISTAAQRLKQELGASTHLFAYPFGEYSEPLKLIVKQMGYYGIAQQSGAVDENTDPRVIPRFVMAKGYDRMDRFITSLHSQPLPVTKIKTNGAEMGEPLQQVTFQIAEANYRAEALACYNARGDHLKLKRVGYKPLRIAIDLSDISNPGRNKINCTAPALNQAGVYFWYSYQWLVKKRNGDWYQE